MAKSKLAYIPMDVWDELQKIKVDLGIKSNSDTLRSLVNRYNKEKFKPKDGLLRW